MKHLFLSNFFFLLFIIFFFIIFFFLILVAFLVLFERNILSFAQMRKGPNIVSFYSLFQTLSDALKLLSKNFLIFSSMRKLFFFSSPIISFFLSVVNWFFFFFDFFFFNFSMSMLFTLLVSSIMVYSIVFAGWSSNNIFSIISSIRAIAQMISYEVVFSFFIFMFFLSFNSFSWSVLGLHNLSFIMFTFFFLFFIWLIIMLAELNRTPFDLVEGESELVGGFNVEFSSSSFTLLFLSEYLSIWFMGSVLSVFFFKVGVGSGFFFILFSVFFIIVSRALLPRFKFMDLMNLVWKYFLPLVSLVFFFFMVFSF